jgi:hypothetical protein
MFLFFRTVAPTGRHTLDFRTKFGSAHGTKHGSSKQQYSVFHRAGAFVMLRKLFMLVRLMKVDVC